MLDRTQAAPALGVLATDDRRQHDHRRGHAGPDAAAGRPRHRPRHGRDRHDGHGNTRSRTTSARATAPRPASGWSTSTSCRAAGATTTKLTATGNNIVGNGYGVRQRDRRGRRPGAAVHRDRQLVGPRRRPVDRPAQDASATRSTAPRSPTAASARRRSRRPATPSCDHRRGADGGDRPADGEQASSCRARPTRCARSPPTTSACKSVAFAVGGTPVGTDSVAPYAIDVDAGRRARGPDGAAGRDDHRLGRPGDGAADAVNLTPAPTPTPTPTATATPAVTATPTATATPRQVRAAAAEPTTVAAPARRPRRDEAAGAGQGLAGRKVAKGRKLTLSGALTLPAGVTCPAGGRVSLSFSAREQGRQAHDREARRECAYKVTATLPRSAARPQGSRSRPASRRWERCWRARRRRARSP